MFRTVIWGLVLGFSLTVNAQDKATQSGPKVTTDTFSDWALECYDPSINGIKCQMIQRVVHDELKQNVLVVSLTYNKVSKKDVVQFVLPLDFNLLPGVLVEIGSFSEALNVNRCAAEGCYVEGAIGESFTVALKKAVEKGRIVLVTQDGTKVSIPFSPKGFTKAYNTMQTRNKAAK